MDMKRLARLAVLTAAALAVHTVEAQIPAFVPVPGVKLGLANAFTLFVMFIDGIPGAAAVLLARVLLGGFASGGFSMLIYSLAGGAVSFAVMAILKKPFGIKFAFLTGAVGGVTHNFAQLFVAVAVTKTPELWAYFPVLAAVGAICGALTGFISGIVVRRIGRYT
ncbi:MAG: Gx transporter family protein [Oscillospiraceae bacterium]|jgi:heptaprenyl diphosphate synthase|nr:Gx transporter family protein [Oscillospiraceae bacterium]